MSDLATTTADPAFSISPNAARRIAALLTEEAKPNVSLRVSVSGGGCAGFQYSFVIDDASNADDRVFERDGARVVVDEVSLELIQGAEIDFVEDLLGSYFKVANPNATSSCGCGTSFSI